MTDSAGLGVGAGQNPRPGARKVVLTLLRVLGANVAILATYYLLPLDRPRLGERLRCSASAFPGLSYSSSFRCAESSGPSIRCSERSPALATSAPLFLLLFAGTYYVLGGLSASNFSESMTRTDALYFTVTVFATVGFGDITATSQGARALVTGQMVAGIVIVGIGARIIVDAIKYGRQQQPVQQANAEPTFFATSAASR